MDVADLPAPVAQAVAELAGHDPERVAIALRLEAIRRMNAATACFAACEWRYTSELLALAQGYLTAADRAVEDRAA